MFQLKVALSLIILAIASIQALRAPETAYQADQISNLKSAINILFTEKEYFYPTEEFDFHVYCPATYEMWYQAKTETNKNIPYQQYISKLDPELLKVLEKTIFARTRNSPYMNQNGTLRLYFCGFVKKKNQSCQQKGHLACTSPGPIIEAESYKELNVMWINMMTDISNFTKDLLGCYQNNTAERCKLMSKDGENCDQKTYLDPCTNRNPPKNENSYTVSNKHPIMSTHVHGMEVRPSFDGNPLSWFNNNGSVGSGYFSQDMPYFGPKPKPIQDMIDYVKKDSNVSYRINSYPNAQQPGSLWYHDHAMSITQFNVQSGLYSFYLIRDLEKESCLPNNDQEKFVFITGRNSTNEVSCKLSSNKFHTNKNYRLRILNGHFENGFQVFFQVMDTNGPTTQKIPFWIIGLDSAIRNFQSKKKYEKIFLAPAQRIDIIIQFDRNIFTDGKYARVFMKGKQSLVGPSMHIIPSEEDPPSTDYSQCLSHFPFADYTQFSEDEIAVRRMRPIVQNVIFGINGHLSFHAGESQNPMIGTVEDWYMINTITLGHPIHIHLIQYQHEKEFCLKLILNPNGKQCTFYEVDFMLLNPGMNMSLTDPAQKASAQRIRRGAATLEDYQILCDALKGLTTEQYIAWTKDFSNENTTEKTSGIDVLELLRVSDSPFRSWDQEQKACKERGTDYGNRYKYICANITDQIPDQRTGYMETTLVDIYHVVVIRVRWAKSHMTNEEFRNAHLNKQDYFTVPEADLLEYPGFVYHCHILPHEDSEMMRPIMMQPHVYADGTTKTQPWNQAYHHQNLEFCNMEDYVKRFKLLNDP